MVKLLVVDDSTKRRQHTIGTALSIGFAKDDITEAASYEEAMQAIEKPGQKFDMAVVDMYLTDPPADTPEGWTVIQRLNQKDNKCRIIGLSASTEINLAAGALRRGACDFVSTGSPHINGSALLGQRMELWKIAVELHKRAQACVS